MIAPYELPPQTTRTQLLDTSAATPSIQAGVERQRGREIKSYSRSRRAEEMSEMSNTNMMR